MMGYSYYLSLSLSLSLLLSLSLSGASREYSSLSKAVKMIVKKEGIKGLYKGLGPQVIYL